MSTLFQSEADPISKPTLGEYPEPDNLPGLKLLAVSFSYPPKSEPRAIQVSRLLKHLEVSTVLVCEGATSIGSNECRGLGDMESFLQRTIRVPLPTSTRRHLMDRLSQRIYIPIWSRTPDHLGAWKSPVLTTIQQLMTVEGYKPNVVATFAFPLVDNIIGLELKQRLQLPWLAHFSDPWVDSPFRTEDRLTRALNERLEHKVIEGADRLVFTSEETASLVMKKYRSDLYSKVRIVAHAYESHLFAGDTNDKDDPLTIRYLGDLYSGRTPKPLFQALEILSTSEPELLRRFRFEIIGDTHNLNLDKMGFSNLPEGLVVIRSRVDYIESLALMKSAAGLMVIDAPVAQNGESVFLPSKLIEYVGADRPIIGLTPRGTAANLISRLGGWIADPASATEVAEVVRQFLSFILKTHKSGTGWGRAEVRKEFEANKVAREFKQVLRELL